MTLRPRCHLVYTSTNMLKLNVLFKFLNIINALRCANCNITISNNDKPYSRIKLMAIDSTATVDPNAYDDVKNDLVSDFFDKTKLLFQPNVSSPPSNTELLKFIGLTRTTKELAIFENTALTIVKMNSTLQESTTLYPKKKFLMKNKNRKRIHSSISNPKEDDLKDSTISAVSIFDDHDVDIMDQSIKPKLACIVCDNVSSKDCNAPKNKLLPVTRCEEVGDVCYTMQTPFGVIDRGCYNPVMYPSTYVCSCNLCNSIPIHDLPHTFISRKDWLYNVQELSQEIRSRNSFHNHTTCLKCEVNQTIDAVRDSNCQEGKYRILPKEDCKRDEVCGIKSIKNEGYIWRGCMKFPRYNYLWNFCNHDLCNTDPPISLFEIDL